MGKRLHPSNGYDVAPLRISQQREACAKAKGKVRQRVSLCDLSHSGQNIFR